MSAFISHKLTEEEHRAGSILTPLQMKVFQNRLHDYAMQKVSLTMDMTNIHASLQTEAELQGQIRLLQDIIETSNTLGN